MIVVTFAGAAARGPGVVALGSIVELAKPYPNLRLEIRLQLVRANLKADAVSCDAEQLPVNWTKLKGKTIAPYVCRIGKRTLTISASSIHYDTRGKRLDARDPELGGKAVRLTETHLKWRWS